MLIATAQQAQTILDNGVQSQQAIADAMDNLWNLVLNSPLYGAVAQIGAYFAYGTIALFIYNWLKEVLEEEKSVIPWEKWLLLAVVVTLLHNHGAFLKDVTFGLRATMNTLNESVLTSTVKDSKNLIDSFNEISTQGGIQTWYDQQVKICAANTDPKVKHDCLTQAQNTANQAADRGAPDSPPGLWQSVTGAIGSVFETSLIGFLLALGIAVQWLVEITWILTALVGPIAVGGALLPVQQKSIYAWLIGFYSIGLYKLFFNILIGMVAMVQLSAGDVNSLIFAICLQQRFAIATGLLSPVLALTLAMGGGWATFTSLASISGAVAGRVGASGVGVASGAGRMGIRMAAHPAICRGQQAYNNRVPASGLCLNSTILMYCHTMLVYYSTMLVYCSTMLVYFPALLMYFPALLMYFSALLIYFPALLVLHNHTINLNYD